MKAILTGLIFGFTQAISSEMHRQLSEDGVHMEHRMLSSGQADLFQMSQMTNFQPKFSAAPQMSLISPMGRYITRKKIKDEDGNIIEDDSLEVVSESDTNPHLEPCGGFPRGRVHFDTEPGSKAMISWKVKYPDVKGNCTVRLGNKGDAGSFMTLYPLDNSGKRTKGKFPCGREASGQEFKHFKFPSNTTCDSCTLQLIWETKASGRMNMCADIAILGGEKIQDCSGQCSNGGICLNGECQCRKGFQGKFCEIVEYVPDKTNYTMYLKYFLFFIIMVLVIVALLFGGHLLFKSADRIRDKLKDMVPKRPEGEEAQVARAVSPEDPDALGGAGIQPGESRFGQNAELFDN